jgi:hypothetical protein
LLAPMQKGPAFFVCRAQHHERADETPALRDSVN